MTRLNPLFKWFGSSWSSAKHYPKPLDGLPIFEPFGGGAGYSLNYYWHDVTIYDINPYLQVLWPWLINEATSSDILAIPLDLPYGYDIRELKDLSLGQKILLKSWQRTNTTGNCWTVSPWGSKPGQWTANTRSRVAEQVYAIKHWKFQPIGWSTPGTYFADPPYKFNFTYGVKNFDYGSLVQNVNRVPSGSLVVVSEAICPKSGLVPDYLPFEFSHRQVTSRRKKENNHHSKELVYVKYV